MVWLPGVSVPSVGAVGTVRGVASNVDDAGELPAAFVATIDTVYCVPLVSPEMSQPVAAVVQVKVLVPSVALAV